VYVSTESARAGQGVDVHAFSNPGGTGTAEVFRLGDYGGAGARLEWSSGPLSLPPQAPCPPQPGTELVECDWPTTTTFTVGQSWLSGVYVVKVSRSDGTRAFTPFVVRDGRSADLLLQPNFTTDQAYNGWNGESLYKDLSGLMPSGKATMVSFNRPYFDSDGLGRFAWRALDFVQFVERSGYDVTYATNLDFLRDGHLLDHVGALVIPAHDEYWPAEERAAVDAAVARGTSVVYFGANGGYWRIRVGPDAHGDPLRTIICFKGIAGDPQPGSTVRYRDPPGAEPENALWGIMYSDYLSIPFPFFVADPDSWIFAGTGVKGGDRFLDLIGTEYDNRHDNGLTPSGLEIAGESPVISAEGVPDVSQLATRDLPDGGIVFAAGAIDWTAGLSPDPALHDARVERIVRNVLERALARWRPPVSLPPVSGPVPTEPAPDGAWASQVEPFAGTAGVPGELDGPGATAQFSGPAGLARAPDGSIVVAEIVGQKIRVIANDAAHTVSTLAGSGTPGAYNGAGTDATFRNPVAVAVDATGAVYVADSANARIRRVDPGPRHQVSTVTGGAAGFADGPLASARFRMPMALAFAPDGSLLVVDEWDARIRRVDLRAGQVTTVAGNGQWGLRDAARGTDARFQFPSAIAVTGAGDMLVTDAINAAVRRIGNAPPYPVTTLVGGTGRFGFADGDGTSALLRAQFGAAVTPDGFLIVADTANFRLRQVTLGTDRGSTLVRTLAGSGNLGSALGDGAHSDLVTPAGLAALPDGSVVVSDPWNAVIRRVVR
jgi:sugar lactone lactonase YvrE